MPFIVFAFLAHVEKERATPKNDPDQEISEWKWVPISKDTPELLKENRHAKDDFVLEHLKVHEVRMSADQDKKMPKIDKDPRDQGRTAQEVSKDLQTAGMNENPEIPGQEQQPSVPEPKAKTPEELQKDPEEFLKDENATGD